MRQTPPPDDSVGREITRIRRNPSNQAREAFLLADAEGRSEGIMPFRCRVVLSCCWRSNIALLLVLWAVSPLSMGFAGCSVHTWHDRGRPGLVRRDHVTRWAGTGATAAFGVVDRNDGMVMSISSYSARSIGEKLEEMEQWLDESGVDRRGGGSGPPSARLRRFSGKGVGLEAGVELERDSTVRRV